MNRDHSGIVFLLICLIGIVFLAVGLSLLIDHRTLPPRQEQRLAAGIETHSQLIRDLEARAAMLKTRIQESRPISVDEYRTTISTLRQRKEDLENSEQELRKAIAATRAAIESCRRQQREMARMAAVGLKMETLRLPSGRIYQDVEILGCDAAKIHIKHSEGSARILVSNLPKDWRDRLMWTPHHPP